jgi:hypothetical protein
MKKEFLGWLICLLYVFSVIYGIGWNLHTKGYVAVAGVVILAGLAFPKVKEAFKNATGRGENE